MRAVDLLPADYGRRRAGEQTLPRLPLPGRLANPLWSGSIVCAVVVIAALGFGQVSAGRTVDERRQTLETLQVELEARRAAESAPVPESDAAVRLAAAAAASSARVAWEEVLHQFSLVLPPDVTITSLTAAAAPPTLSLGGYTASQPSVARLLTRLDEAPSLANVQLQTSARVDLENRPVIQFSVLTDVVPGGPGS